MVRFRSSFRRPLVRAVPFFAAVALAVGGWGWTAAQPLTVTAADLAVSSDGRDYASYLAAPDGGGPWPAVVLIHSFNGLEPGYRSLTERLAAEGFVVLTLGWQTFERQPGDAVVQRLVEDGVALLAGRADVDPARIGLTGFCAGGYQTMRLLPLLDVFAAGVAWYGFPYNGDPTPASLAGQLDRPLLVIHGSADRPSAVADIYRYVQELDAAGAPYELKVYQGEPHGFMLEGGELRSDALAEDAFGEMVRFFRRKL